MARDRHPVSSLLHPTYGVAAADIRSAVGASQAARLERVTRQLDAVRRATVLRARDFRGLVIQQDGTYLGTRITPSHRRFVGVDCPDGSILFEQGADTHEIRMCVDIEVIKTMLLEDPGFSSTICASCDPGPG